MKQKKLLIIAIIIIAVVIIGLGGFIFAYMTTDILKSDEQLFYKYLSAFTNDIPTFTSQNLENYLNKMQTTPYESIGDLTVNATLPDATSKDLDIVNNMSISYEGKTDNANNLSEQNISINYSDSVTLPIIYKHTGNAYGLTSEKIINGSEIIAVTDEDLIGLAKKLGVTVNIPEDLGTLDIDTIMKQLINEFPKLQQIIINNITPANFSKVDEKDFLLTLTNRQCLTIILQMVQEIKNSGILPESFTEYVNAMEEELQNANPTDEALLKIAVSKDKRITISVEEEILLILSSTNAGITIQITDSEDAPIVTLQKVENEDFLSYKISFTQGENEISFVMNYSELQSPTVNENYVMTLSVATSDEGAIKYQYNFNTTKTFVDSVEIEEITSDNSFIVNEKVDIYGADTIKALLEQIGTTIEQVSNEQMQELGLSTNPLILATPIGLLNLTSYPEDVDNLEVQTFNASFLNYEGPQKGSTTNTLIDRVIANNQIESEHIVSVNGYTDESSLQSLQSQVNPSSEYNITFNYNSEGYINSITIASK